VEGFRKFTKKFPQLILWFILAAFLLLLPTFLPLYYLIHSIDVIIIILFAVSFNLLYGYMKEISFGHAGFFGLGAYTMVALTKYTEVNLFIAMSIGMLFVLLYALLVSPLVNRLSGIFFALCSLAFGEFIAIIVWSSRDLGGDVGLHFSLITLKEMKIFYYIVLAIASICIIAMYKIVNSPFSLAIRAIGDNQSRVECIGIKVLRYRMAIFIISAAFTGIAGLLYSILHGIVHPRIASWEMVTSPLVGTLLGGAEIFSGPIIGTAIYYTIYWKIGGITSHWEYFTGGLIIILVIFVPKGIMPTFYTLFKQKLKKEP
jgi:branched-chain amino acid transport system permease protein